MSCRPCRSKPKAKGPLGRHPDHAEIADWFDGCDPDGIDELVLKIALSRIARRRNPAEAAFGRRAQP